MLRYMHWKRSASCACKRRNARCVGRGLPTFAEEGAYSSSVNGIWDNFKFKEKIDDLEQVNRLFQITNHFANKIDFDPEKVSNTFMGDIFEHVMYRAFDKKGKAAGAFYTPRDAIR